MSSIIYKYSILPGGQEIQLPKEAKVLDVQAQRGEPQMWVLLDPAAPTCARHFVALPTGRPFEVKEAHRLDYIGTFQLQEGYLVYHLFETMEP